MQRSERVGEEMRKVISVIVRDELRDPRIPMLTTITDVVVSRDLSHANVYVSIYGNENEKKECLEAFKKAASFIRREVSQNMSLRISPELHFIQDDSIEKGARMSKLIDDAIKKDKEKSGGENKN